MDMLPELDERSVFDVVEENFKKIGLRANAIRMYYCGEHTLSKEEIIKHFRATIDDVNSSYCEINVNGFLVAYDSYFVHIIEGSEDTVHRQIRFLLRRELDYIESLKKQDEEVCIASSDSVEGLAALEEPAEKPEKIMFRRMKMLMVYHSRKKLLFKRWRAVTARPPTLVSKLNVHAPLVEHMEQLKICLDKIKKLIALALQHDGGDKGYRADYRSANKQLTFEGASAVGTRMDALPEVALLSFLLDSTHLLDLRQVSYLHRRVDDYAYYSERVWPVPTHYTPRHLYKLKIDDSFVDPLPVMPWEQKQGEEDERGERSGSESSD